MDKIIQVKEALVSAGVFEEGHFVFADGAHATTKVEMDRLWEHPADLETIIKLMSEAMLPPTDIIIGVPRGGTQLAERVGERLGIPIVELERVPGGTKQDFRFATAVDQHLAETAQSIRIIEDVVTTLSSVAGVVRLLDPTKQVIHSLAIWRRGEVKAEYQTGVKDFYLVEELMPNLAPEDCNFCK